VAIAAGLALIAGIASVAVFELGPSLPAENEIEQASPEQKTSVKLSAGKLHIAHLHVAACQMHDLEDVRTVPGKINYNESQRWDIKTPVEGVVQKVLVDQSQSVKMGEPLAVISSANEDISWIFTHHSLTRREFDRALIGAFGCHWITDLTDVLDQLRQRRLGIEPGHGGTGVRQPNTYFTAEVRQNMTAFSRSNVAASIIPALVSQSFV
jgi:hypothetical protein